MCLCRSCFPVTLNSSQKQCKQYYLELFLLVESSSLVESNTKVKHLFLETVNGGINLKSYQNYLHRKIPLEVSEKCFL